MKKLFCLLLCATTVSIFGQGSTLYKVNMVKPKGGMRSAFEASWKMHLDKFHKTSDKRSVYEVTNGPGNGSYIIVEGPISYADMDKENPTAKDHALDLEKNFTPKLDVTGTNMVYRWADTLSYHGDGKADNFLVTIAVLKDGKAGEYMTEIRRTVLILEKIKSQVSFNVMIKQFAGSSPTIVTLRNLKNGFKELEADYFKMAPDAFKNAYITDYGQDGWDKRLKLQVDDVENREQHFEKYRADLSSK